MSTFETILIVTMITSLSILGISILIIIFTDVPNE